MKPPAGVRVTTALMYLTIITGLLVFLLLHPLTLVWWDNVVLGRIGAIVLTILQGTVVFFYYKGHNWARWVVIFGAVWELRLLVGIKGIWKISHLTAGIVVASMVLALYLLVYLTRGTGRAYFTSDAEERA